jgi:hypothetical protein
VNQAALAWRYLWARLLVAGLNLALLALGVSVMVFLLLVGAQFERSLQRDLAGIDLVIRAKGSPLQLILAGVFHLNVPTGNVALVAVQIVRDNPLVDQVIPLALGDSHTVKLEGFMMPLQPGEKQRHFLLSSVPTTCSFCVPAGPEGLVEIRSRGSVKYTLEPVMVEGRIAVLTNDPSGCSTGSSMRKPSSHRRHCAYGASRSRTHRASSSR